MTNLLLLKNELNENDYDCVNQLLESIGTPPDIQSQIAILLSLKEAYDVCLKLTWPEKLRQEYETELEVIIKSLSSLSKKAKDNNINSCPHSSVSNLKGSIQDYPLAAIFAEPVFYLKHDSNFFIAKILTFILFQLYKSGSISIDESFNSSSEYRAMINGKRKITASLKYFEFDAKKISGFLSFYRESDKSVISKSLIISWDNYFKGEETKLKKARNKPNKNKIKLEVSHSNVEVETPIAPCDDEISQNHEKLLETYTEDKLSDNEQNSASSSNKSLDFYPKTTLYQRLQILYRSDALLENEELNLVRFLVDILQSATSNQNDHEIALLSILSIVTSRDLGYILDLPIYREFSDGEKEDYICLDNCGVWVKASIKKPESFTQDRDTEILNTYRNQLQLPIGDVLTSTLNTLIGTTEDGTSLRSILNVDDDVYLSSFITSSRKVLLNKELHLHRNVTDQHLRRSSFEWISKKYSTGIASIVLSNSEFDKTTILYYLSLSAKFACYVFLERLYYLGLNTNTEIKCINYDYYTGSELTLSAEKVSDIVNLKYEKLTNKLETAYRSDKAAIVFHNEFAEYITAQLTMATAHRDTLEYGFTSYTIDLARGLILVFDKYSFENQPYRVLVLPKLVVDQLFHYKTHLKNLAHVFKHQKSELSKSLLLVASDKVSNLPFLFKIKDEKIVHVGKNDFDHFFENLYLPSNFNRHFIVDQLTEIKAFSQQDYLLGHNSISDTPLGKTSCASLLDSSLLSENIELILIKSGFKLIKIAGKRGIKSSQDISHKLLNYYTPLKFKTSKEPIFKFINRLIKHFKGLLVKAHKLLDGDDTFLSLLDWSENDKKSQHISSEKKKSLILRFLKKINSKNEQKIIEPDKSLSFIDHSLISTITERDKVVAGVNAFLFDKTDKQSMRFNLSKKNILWIKFSLSLIINNPLSEIKTKSQLFHFINAEIFSSLELNLTSVSTENNISQPMFVDNTSMIFRLEAERSGSINCNDFNRSMNIVLKYIPVNINISLNTSQTMSSIDGLLKFIKTSWNPEQPTILKSFESGELDTTPISHDRLIRWLSDESIKIPTKKVKQTDRFSSYGQSYILPTSGNMKNTIRLYLNIHDVLDKANQSTNQQSTSIYNLILKTWALFVDLKVDSPVDEIINASTKITAQGVTYFLWLLDVSTRPGKSQSNIATSTVKGYASKSKALITESDFKSEDFTLLVQEDLIDWYRDAAETSRDNKAHADYIAKIKDYHKFLVDNFGFEDVEWHNVEPEFFKSDAIADANIISFNEYSKSLEVINNNDLLTSDAKGLASISLTLMYRLGLRPNDLRGVMVDDFDFNNQILYIRSNRIRRVKSSSGNRILPFKYLLTINEVNQFKVHCRELNTRYGREKNIPIFVDKDSINESLGFYPALSIVKETLKQVTLDEDVKIYHLRHSFANYLYLVMNYREDMLYQDTILNELERWCVSNNLKETSISIREDLTGEKHNFLKVMPAISRFMGHSHPETTIRHYIHIMHLHHLMFSEAQLAKNIEKKDLVVQTSIERTHAYKIISRSPSRTPAQSLIQHYKNKIIDLSGYPVDTLKSDSVQDLLLTEVEHEIKKYRMTDFYELNGILKCLVNNVSNAVIETKFMISNSKLNLIKDNFDLIKRESGYRGYGVVGQLETPPITPDSIINENKHCSVLENICYIISKLNLKQLTQLCELWKKNYCQRGGIVIDKSSYQVAITLLVSNSLNFKLKDKQSTVTEKWGKRFGYQLLCFTQSSTQRSHDKKLSQALFLKSLLLKINEN